MFATLLGGLPQPSPETADLGEDARVAAAIRAQEAAGLEPITDGRLRGELLDWVGTNGSIDANSIVAAWRFAARQTDRAVKQALPGPYSIGWRCAATVEDRARTTEVAAASVREAIAMLAAAGCPLIEIEETEAHRIGSGEEERRRFIEAHERTTEGIGGVHLALSIVGGSAWEAGIETIASLPYSSLAVDLIEGADNWNLVTRWPGDRGVVVGALPAKASPADAKEMLLWAARYAAGSNGRGLERVGIGSAGSWARLTWEAAVEKLRRLGDAAALAARPGGRDLARQLDPRAVDARTAAMGHDPASANPVDPVD